MKVVSVVLNNFLNDSRVLKEAITLKNNGYEINVVALHEGDLKENELVNDIPVNRIKLNSRNLPNKMFFQIFKYLEYSRKMIVKYKSVDIFHSNDLEPLPIAVFIKKFINPKMKIVYDAHEYEAERNGMKGFRKKLTKFVEKTLIRYVDSTITVSDGIAEEYSKLYNVPLPEVVLNCPNYRVQKKSNLFREKFNIEEDKTIFLYQGGLTNGRYIELFLESFSKMENESAVLVVMGYGPLRGLVHQYSMKYNNIFLQDAVSPDILLNYTSSADIGLCIIENTCLSYYYSLPNKFFEYIMAGLPVITNDIPELKKKIESYNVGLVLESLNSNELIKAIEEITVANSKGLFTENVKNMASIYNWEKQESNLIKAYQKIRKVI